MFWAQANLLGLDMTSKVYFQPKVGKYSKTKLLNIIINLIIAMSNKTMSISL